MAQRGEPPRSPGLQGSLDRNANSPACRVGTCWEMGAGRPERSAFLNESQQDLRNAGKAGQRARVQLLANCGSAGPGQPALLQVHVRGTAVPGSHEERTRLPETGEGASPASNAPPSVEHGKGQAGPRLRLAPSSARPPAAGCPKATAGRRRQSRSPPLPPLPCGRHHCSSPSSSCHWQLSCTAGSPLPPGRTP